MIMKNPFNGANNSFDNSGTDLISTNSEDAIKEVNTNFNARFKTEFLNNYDLDTITKSGFYVLGYSNTHTPNNRGYDWCSLTVCCNDSDTGSQIYVDSQDGGVFERVLFNGTWGSWNELALKSDIPTVKSAIVTLDTNNYNRVADTGLLVSKCVPLCAEVAGYQCVIGSSYNDHWYASIIEHTSGSTVTLSISATIYYLEK